MGSSISIGNGVGKTKNLIVVGVVILEDTIDENVILHHLPVVIDLHLPLSL